MWINEVTSLDNSSLDINGEKQTFSKKKTTIKNGEKAKVLPFYCCLVKYALYSGLFWMKYWS